MVFSERVVRQYNVKVPDDYLDERVHYILTRIKNLTLRLLPEEGEIDKEAWDKLYYDIAEYTFNGIKERLEAINSFKEAMGDFEEPCY